MLCPIRPNASSPPVSGEAAWRGEALRSGATETNVWAGTPAAPQEAQPRPSVHGLDWSAGIWPAGFRTAVSLPQPGETQYGRDDSFDQRSEQTEAVEWGQVGVPVCTKNRNVHLITELLFTFIYYTSIWLWLHVKHLSHIYPPPRSFFIASSTVPQGGSVGEKSAAAEGADSEGQPPGARSLFHCRWIGATHRVQSHSADPIRQP